MAHNRTEYLQALADELKHPDAYDFWVEYSPFMGWYLRPEMARWFGDEGEFLGTNWREAEKTLRRIL